MFECCNKKRIQDAFLNRDPTVNDTQIDPYTFVVNESTGDIFFKTKDANGNPKITKLSGGGGGGGGVESLNGLTGDINITADPPLEVTPSGSSIKVKLTEKYIKTINKIPPDSNGNFDIDKTDPITITDGTAKVTVGSTGGGTTDAIKKIIIDDVTLEPEADGSVNLKGDLVQGIQVIQDGA